MDLLGQNILGLTYIDPVSLSLQKNLLEKLLKLHPSLVGFST